METNELILSLADQARGRLAQVFSGEEMEDSHIRDARVLLEAAEALRRMEIVIEGLRLGREERGCRAAG